MHHPQLVLDAFDAAAPVQPRLGDNHLEITLSKGVVAVSSWRSTARLELLGGVDGAADGRVSPPQVTHPDAVRRNGDEHLVPEEHTNAQQHAPAPLRAGEGGQVEDGPAERHQKDDHLDDDGAQYDDAEVDVSQQAGSDVPLAVNLAAVHLIEDGHQHKDVKDEGEVLGRASVTVLFNQRRGKVKPLMACEVKSGGFTIK